MSDNKKLEEHLKYYNDKLKEVQTELNDLLSSDYSKSDPTDVQLQYEALTNKIDILTEELGKIIKESK